VFGYDSQGLNLPHPPTADGEPSGATSIFAAVQKLGLKREPGKGTGAFLVIDGAERPAGN